MPGLDALFTTVTGVAPMVDRPFPTKPSRDCRYLAAAIEAGRRYADEPELVAGAAHAVCELAREAIEETLAEELNGIGSVPRSVSGVPVPAEAVTC